MSRSTASESSGGSVTSSNCPTTIQQPARATVDPAPAHPDVGEVLRRMNINRELSAGELEQHIADLGVLWRDAYARYERDGDPHARDEALVWLHEQNAAILRRSPQVLAARHAAFERHIAEGCGYFVDQGERDRAHLGGRS